MNSTYRTLDAVDMHRRQADLYEALQSANVPRWSKTTIQLYFAVFITFCCSCANGYDGSLFTGEYRLTPCKSLETC